MLPACRPFGQSLIDPIFDSGRDGAAVFLRYHHMTDAVNTFLAEIDRGGVDSGLFQPTLPRCAVHFNIGFTDQEKADLVAFLGPL